MAIDQAVYQFCIENRNALLDPFMVQLSRYTAPAFLILAAGVWSLYRLATRAPRPLYPFLAVATASLCSRITKILVDRPRPPEGTRMVVELSPAMPSGHTVAAFVLATVVVLLWRRRWAYLGWVLAASISISRLYLGVHWLSDVLVGALLGIAVALAWWQVGRARVALNIRPA